MQINLTHYFKLDELPTILNWHELVLHFFSKQLIFVDV